jgi:hypothetical protein
MYILYSINIIYIRINNKITKPGNARLHLIHLASVDIPCHHMALPGIVILLLILIYIQSNVDIAYMNFMYAITTVTLYQS